MRTLLFVLAILLIFACCFGLYLLVVGVLGDHGQPLNVISSVWLVVILFCLIRGCEVLWANKPS